MRLRGIIQRPLRYEDEDINFRKPYQKSNGTKPAFPELLAAQTVAFQSRQRPAAFPTLPLTTSIAEAPPDEPHAIESDEEAPAEPRRQPQPQSQLYSPGDSALLLNGEVSTIDFEQSGDLAGVDDSHSRKPRIKWSSLEWAYRFRIFNALSNVRGSEDAGKWLGLSEEELRGMETALEWRQSHPVTLTQVGGGLTTLGDCLEPEYMMKHIDLIVEISNFELGSPHELPDARRYLLQQCLPPALLGTWRTDPLGSGQLIDVTPLSHRFPVESLTVHQMQQLSKQAARGGWKASYLRKRPDIGPPKPKMAGPTSDNRPARKQQPMDLAHREQQEINIQDIIQPPAPTSNSSDELESRTTRDSGAEPQHGQVDSAAKMPPNGPLSIVPQKRLRESNASSNLGVTDTLTPAPSLASDRSSGERNAGSMSLRNRGDLKETRAMVESRKDITFWSTSRNSSPEETSSRFTPKQTHEISLSELGVPNSPPKKVITLRYDKKGWAYVATTTLNYEQPVNPPSAAVANPNFLPQATQYTSLPPITPLPQASTPPAAVKEVEEPARLESVKQEVVHFDLMDLEPSRFGELANFDTKLILSSEAEPTTPKVTGDDAGGESDAEGTDVFHTPWTHPDEKHPGSSPIYSSEFDVQNSPLAGRGGHAELHIVPSVEENAGANNSIAGPGSIQVLEADGCSRPETPNIGLTHHFEHAGPASPLRPRSISPISDNEDDLEYQAFLRGEREQGPTPLESFLCKHIIEEVATEGPIVTDEENLGDVASLAESFIGEANANASLDVSLRREVLPVVRSIEEEDNVDAVRPQLKVTLKVKVPDRFLSQPQVTDSRSITAEPNLIVPDPGEDGDISWTEDQPKKKKRKIKTPNSRSSAPINRPAGSRPSIRGRSTKNSTNGNTSQALPTARLTRATGSAPASRNEKATPVPVTKGNKSAPARKRSRLASIENADDNDSFTEASIESVTNKKRKLTGKSAKKATTQAPPKATTKPPSVLHGKPTTFKSAEKGSTSNGSSNGTSVKLAQAPGKKSTVARRQPQGDTDTPKAGASTAKQSRKKSTVAAKTQAQARTRASSHASSTKPSRKAFAATKSNAEEKAMEIDATSSSTEINEPSKEARPQERRRMTRAQTPAQAVVELESITIHDSASEADSEVASSQTTKPRKPWTHKEYTKTRGSSRLAEMKHNDEN